MHITQSCNAFFWFSCNFLSCDEAIIIESPHPPPSKPLFQGKEDNQINKVQTLRYFVTSDYQKMIFTERKNNIPKDTETLGVPQPPPAPNLAKSVPGCDIFSGKLGQTR